MNTSSLDLLRRVTQLREEPQTPIDADDDEACCASFGYLRGVRERALELEFRRNDPGDSFTFPYTWLGPTRHHPSTGIQLLFVGPDLFLVTLRGRNLNRTGEGGVSLYERGLLRHRITWVRDVPREESKGLDPAEAVIERIEIATISPEQAAKAFGFASRIGPGPLRDDPT